MSNWNHAIWTPWAQPAVPFYLVLTLNPSFAPLREQIGVPLFTSVLLFEEGTGTWLFRSDEAAALGQRMIDLLSVPANRSAFEDRLSRSVVTLESTIEAVRAALTNQCSKAELRDLYRRLEGDFGAFYQLGAFVEPVQVAGQVAINRYLEANRAALASAAALEPDDLEAAIYVLDQDTFAIAMTESLAQCARAFGAASGGSTLIQNLLNDHLPGNQPPSHAIQPVLDSEPGLAREMERHATEYWWSRNNYERCLVLTPEDVIQEILALGSPADAASILEEQVSSARSANGKLRDAKRRLSGRLPAYELNLLSLHEFLGGRLLDMRKRLVQQTNGTVAKLLEAIAIELECNVAALEQLLPQELDSFMGDPERYGERLSNRRRKFVLYQADVGVLDELSLGGGAFAPMDGPYLAEGVEQSDKLLDRLAERLNLFESGPGQSSTIKGVTVYFDEEMPVVSGRVRIVRDPIRDPLEVGEILVASSTTPDFMSAIHRCAAIVTDWGGQTSHAAITARELKKPCVIGTNFASSLLKTGEIIEIDLRSGLIGREAQ